jgi:formylglycine-generating enzyme required for sulfatase activity
MDHPEEPEPHHNLVLAAEALRDVGPARTEGDLAGDIQRRLRTAFEAPLRRGNDLKAQVQRRAAAAEALGRIEGGVFGAQPAFWTLPHGIPVWVEIPAGEFWMGSDDITGAEKPVHRLHLDRYWISRVPVTNAQYRFFVEATQHESPRHWEDGTIPRGWENHPVVYVSWHDALAYAGWLDEQMRTPGARLYAWHPQGLSTFDFRPETYAVSLPSEAEWEKAARGALDKRAYPWGDDWREGYCNTDELGLSETSPVGVFPEGTSPYGALEMAGNVWEWTRSAGRAYPYVIDDGRENLDAGDDVRRVLRGGAFLNSRSGARCASRLRYFPDYHFRYYGFRVVVSVRQDKLA